MVIKTEEGWLGADGKYYDYASGAHESFARKLAVTMEGSDLELSYLQACCSPP